MTTVILWNIDEAARQLGDVSARTVRRMLANGELPKVKVRGAVRILGTIERTLGIQAGETDANLEFTLETVNCLGACALGPVVVVNGEYHGQMTSAKATRLLKRLRKSDEKSNEAG